MSNIQSVNMQIRHLTEDIPGDSLEERVNWMREEIVELKQRLRDIRGIVGTHADRGDLWIWRDELAAVMGAEHALRGGDKYRGLTLVDQRAENDCMSACITSLTGVPIEQVPNFAQVAEWRLATDSWAVMQGGHWIRRHSAIRWPLNRNSEAFMAFGASPRRSNEKPDLTHAVLIDRWGDLVFDPHYSRRGISGVVREVWQWSVDPAKKQGR